MEDATAGEFVINTMRVMSTASIARGGAAAAAASTRCAGIAANGILGEDGKCLSGAKRGLRNVVNINLLRGGKFNN